MRSEISATLIGTAIGLFTTYAIAQSTITNKGEGSRSPITFKESLQARGIGLSHASLVAALQNGDPQVRIEAASVIAQNHDPEAASLIESALASESNPKATVFLASTLMGLDDATGVRRLTEICTDAALPSQIVADAIFHLVFRGSGAQCIDGLIKRLQDPNKLDSAMQLIPSLGPLYKKASQAQQTEILAALQNHLSDKEPTTRMVASRALAQTALPNSADIIKTALQGEADPMVRAGMQSDLTALTGKH
jgi:HEAT repeat protein